MKAIFLVVFFFPNFCFAQKLVKNEVDEFTKASIKTTSWETITYSGRFVAYASISKIDETYYLNLRVMLPSSEVFSIDKGDELMIKTATDSIITLYNLKYEISCTGCGAKGLLGSGVPGMEVKYKIPSEIVSFLLNTRINKLRIYTTDGYAEGDIKDKNAETLIKLLKLVK